MREMDQNGKLICDTPASTPKMSPTHRTESQGWTWLLCLTGVSTTLGASVPVGYTIGVINTPASIIQSWCNESLVISYGWNLSSTQIDILYSTIVSIFLIGGMIGSLAGSWFADKFGRKGTVIISFALAIISGVMFISCKSLSSVGLLSLARFIIGLASGLITCVIPMYLIEIAPLTVRGAMGVLCPLGVTFGVLLGQFMGLNWLLGTEEHWHYLLGFYLCLTLICSLVIPVLPESPKYLNVILGDKHRALKELGRIRGQSMQEVSHELENNQPAVAVEMWSIRKLLSTRHLFLPLALVCALQAGQQFSGINAVFYYSMKIFHSAGLSHEGSQYASLGAGLVNFFIAVLMIPVVNYCRRRTLILLSCVMVVIMLVLLCISITFMKVVSWVPYFSIVAVLGYVFVYGIGLGPIPYFIGSELFDVGPRPSAMAMGSVANWTGNFVVGMTFPTLQRWIGQYSFLLFALSTAFLTVFLQRCLPETNSRSNIDDREADKVETVPIRNTTEEL